MRISQFNKDHIFIHTPEADISAISISSRAGIVTISYTAPRLTSWIFPNTVSTTIINHLQGETVPPTSSPPRNTHPHPLNETAPQTREKRFRLLLYCLNKERKIPLEGSVNLKRKLLTFSANWGPDDAVVTVAIRFRTFQTPPKSRSRVEIKLEVACRVLSPTGGVILRLIFNPTFLPGYYSLSL